MDYYNIIFVSNVSINILLPPYTIYTGGQCNNEMLQQFYD